MKKTNKIINTLPWLILILMFLILCIYMKQRIIYFLDSDMSSELVLANLLASERKIITSNFFYSTEIRVVHIQLIYTFVFLFTKNWLHVRVISMIIMYVLMLLSYYYLCRNIGTKKYFAISAVFLIVPFSGVYNSYVLKGCCYIPHIIGTFLTIGMIYKYMNISSKNKKGVIICINGILAVLTGMGGPRQIITLYLPLICASIIWLIIELKKCNIRQLIKEKSFGFVINSSVLLICSMLGYIINTKVLAKIYHFQSWNAIKFTQFDISRLIDIINGLINSLGYTKGKVLSIAIINNVMCFVMLTIIVYSIIRGASKKSKSVSLENNQISLVMLSSVVIFTLIYALTDLQYTDRYNLTILILAFPIITLNIKEIKWNKYLKFIAICPVVILILIGSLINYKNDMRVDTTKEFRKISKAVQEQGYYCGYATFWNSNVLTEISNGKVDMYCCAYVNQINKGKIYEWLQLTSHKNQYPKGKVFILLRTDTDEFELYPYKEKLKEENIIYKSKKYVAYGYENYKQILNVN